MENYYLLEKKDKDYCDYLPSLNTEYKIIRHSLKLFSKRGKSRIVNFYWYLICETCDIFEVYDVKADKLIHFSYIMKSRIKFPFLDKNTFMIGPSFTISEFRGQNIYARVLTYIMKEVDREKTRQVKYVALVRKSNSASLKALEKAGFSKNGKEYTKNLLKNYREIKNEK